MKKKEKKQAKKIINVKASNKSKKVADKPIASSNLKKTISSKKIVPGKTKVETKKIEIGRAHV